MSFLTCPPGCLSLFPPLHICLSRSLVRLRDLLPASPAAPHFTISSPVYIADILPAGFCHCPACLVWFLATQPPTPCSYSAFVFLLSVLPKILVLVPHSSSNFFISALLLEPHRTQGGGSVTTVRRREDVFLNVICS